MIRQNRLILHIVMLSVLVLSALFFSSCRADGVASITVSGKNEIRVGEFEYSDYTVEVMYDSGDKEQVALTKEMLSAEDNLKFFKSGEQTLTVNYEGLTCELHLNVCLYEFTDLQFDDISTVYTGEEVTAEVFPNYPAGTTVYYPNGNTFVNAGTYDVTAIVSRDNYVTEKLHAKVKIEQAEYDLSAVRFPDMTVEYDGKSHTAEIAGTLPTGVTVSYPDSNNRQTNAGEYTVTARFVSSDQNYKPISDMTAKLTISPKKYDTTDLTFSDETLTYDGSEHTLSVVNCPAGVTVSYKISKYDDTTENYVALPDTVTVTDAGIYQYEAIFTSNDSNYETLPTMTAVLNIEKAPYDLSGVHFDGCEVTYNGKPQTLTITYNGQSYPLNTLFDGENPTYAKLTDDLTVLLRGFEINDSLVMTDDERIADAVTDYGTYSCTIRIFCNKQNYTATETRTATLVINKADYDVSQVTLEQDLFTYDGNEKSVVVTGLQNDVDGKLKTEILYFDSQPEQDENNQYNNIKDATGKNVTGVTEKGEYYILVVATEQNGNYKSFAPICMLFTIS